MKYSVIDLQKKIIEIYRKFRENYLEYCKEIKKIAQEVFKEKLIAVIVFGSTVKGNYKPWSDIDIGIVVKEFSEKEMLEVLKKVREKFGSVHPFEIHFITEEKWPEFKKFIKHFIVIE
jgi:predicted nucleotidyltransferase